VRVEKPLEFAELLVKNESAYDKLRMEVNLPPIDTTKMKVFHQKMEQKRDTVKAFVLKPAWFGTKKPVPLYINYYTAWWQGGKMQVRADVYEQDEVLWQKLRTYL
jgi:murein L,D-transpeptidase YcbB/YkuD